MLEDKINQDLKEAMKEKNALKVSTLRMLWSDIKNTRIDKRTDSLDDASVLSILKKQVKQRQDSISQFEKAGRSDLSQKEETEMNILKEYLPEEISDEKLADIIDEAIKKTEAQSIKEMGKVMKEVLTLTGGAADNRKVSELVKEKLS